MINFTGSLNSVARISFLSQCPSHHFIAFLFNRFCYFVISHLTAGKGIFARQNALQQHLN